jgi:hypothetical protein
MFRNRYDIINRMTRRSNEYDESANVDRTGTDKGSEGRGRKQTNRQKDRKKDEW